MKIIVVIPTFNEALNIEELIKRILNLDIEGLELVVVDDNSPDNTAGIVEGLSRRDPRVKLLLRLSDKGRGLGGKAGFLYALDHGADVIIEMDADLSHDPLYIPTFLNEIRGAEVVLGSRYVAGGEDTDRGAARLIQTKLAIFYIRLIMGMDIKDPNSGYRCYRRQALAAVARGLESKGADIVQEVIYKLHLKGCRIKEIPIVFKDRVKGETTKNVQDLLRGFYTVLKWRWRKALGKL